MIMKRFITLILTLVAVCCLVLTSCGEELKYTTGVTFTVHENGTEETLTDMISFYTTAEDDEDGSWKHELENTELFETVISNSETKESGFINGISVTYGTLVLKPLSEGEAKMTYTLTNDGKEKDKKAFNLTVKKDDDGILRITAKEVEE